MESGKETNIRPAENFKWFGISILIENPQGTYREGTDPNGQKWSTYMRYPYGFIPVAESADGEGLDVYVGPELHTSPTVFVVNQHNLGAIDKEWNKIPVCPKCKKPCRECACPEYFDEHKVMLGWSSKDDAIRAYLGQYDNPLFLGHVQEVPTVMFHQFLTRTPEVFNEIPLVLKKKAELVAASLRRSH